MENLYKSDALQIGHDSESAILFCNWAAGYVSYDMLKECGIIIYDLFNENHCNKILNDTTLVRGSWHHSVKWVLEDWFPSMFAAGLRQYAWLFPTDVFAKISAQKSLPDTDIIKIFASYPDALAWLKRTR